MNYCTPFHVCFNKGHLFFNIHIVIRKPGNAKAKGAVFKNKVSSSIIIYKLTNIAAFMTKRPKAFYIVKLTVGLVADSYTNACHFITAVIKMEVHYILPGFLIIKNFR